MNTSTAHPPPTAPAAEWVVGFDGSASSRAAAQWASSNVAGRAEALRLVHAWSVSTATVYSAFAPLALNDTMDAVEQAAGSELAAFAAELEIGAPVPIRTMLLAGDAANVLIDEAQHSDLLIVGARGSGRFERLLLGSTSTRCATHAPVPTVVVRSSEHDPSTDASDGRSEDEAGRGERIVVAFDGSPNARDAVDWACTFARPGATVELVSVWEYAPSLMSAEVMHYPEALSRANARFEEQLEALPASARRDDIDFTPHFVQGRPRDQISQRAAGADLLVVGARGRGGIGAALLGSVSTWLLHNVERPVAVVPQAPQNVD